MNKKLGELPNNVEQLHELVRRIVREHDEELAQLKAELEKERSERIEHQNKAIEHFEELQLLRRKLFGRSAEKLSAEEQKQLLLFNEAEDIVFSQRQEPAAEERVEVRAHTRVKRGRKPLPPELPRVEMVHDISEEDKKCACGQELSRIGEESLEKLEVIPPQIRVRRHVRPKYACKTCEGSGDEDRPAVRIAPAVRQLLPKSIASPALVAYVLTAKFCDALPFYRQEKQFQRIGVDISRQDMANWSIAVFQRLTPFIELLRGEIRGGPRIGLDETTLQVMGEPDRPNTSKSYMWVFLGGSPERPVVEFQYHPTRSGKVPLEALRGYSGFIQTDGYDGYDETGRQPGVVHAGCWAHSRRKFFEAKEASKQAGSVDEALARIDALFRIERTLRAQKLSPQEFVRQRREQAEPVLEKLNAWLHKRQGQVPPSLLLGKAIAYTIAQWPKLIRYLDSPHLGPSNNAVEQAIRPFVVGRKNWLISGSPAGAEASAGWYSIIETAKLNGVEPYLFLRYILSRLPEGDNPEDYHELLPWNVPRDSLLSFDSGHLF